MRRVAKTLALLRLREMVWRGWAIFTIPSTFRRIPIITRICRRRSMNRRALSCQSEQVTLSWSSCLCLFMLSLPGFVGGREKGWQELHAPALKKQKRLFSCFTGRSEGESSPLSVFLAFLERLPSLLKGAQCASQPRSLIGTVHPDILVRLCTSGIVLGAVKSNRGRCALTSYLRPLLILHLGRSATGKGGGDRKTM